MSGIDFGLTSIGQISINAHDLERAINFYRDRLGMRFLFQAPKLAFFDAAGVRLMIGLPEKPEFDHPGSILYFKVADIEEAYRTLSQRGVQFQDKPHRVAKLPDHELWLTFFHDSENNLLALMSEKR